ncbi:MAG: DUF3732 domain-containing protein [Clostridia bacterium]|nr:DUF3732 domain-containing protein [Clostridia bacterium]
MFKINKLVMYSYDDNSYTYTFESGINYFVGKNNSGKTEFYKFIDYMFGSSVSIKNSIWYKGSLKKATMFFSYNSISYRLTRMIEEEKCFFSYEDEIEGEAINLREYRDRLQSVFSVDLKTLERLHRLTDENLTYRSFTLFNFLGEIRQGVLVDFFDKCDKIEYSTKIIPILNFLFNKNVERIFWLKNEITKLQEEIKQKELIVGNNNAIIHKVNLNLHKLNMHDIFNGSNGDIILKSLTAMTEQLEKTKPMNTKNISNLEIIYSNIDEQIKVYEKYKSDLQNQQYENKNRETLLEIFKTIISNNQEYSYLVEPLIELTDEIKNSISFSQYILKDEVLNKLKDQREKVKFEILKADMQLTRFSLDEKRKSIAIAEDGIKSFSLVFSPKKLKELQTQLKEYKNELKQLLDSDDVEKLKSISEQITELYKSAYEISDFVKTEFDNTQNKFHIKYIKNRNALQTMTYDEKGNEKIYETGSLAKHTLIQLCGYLIFMKMLIEENKYPVIPLLVIDHISKPFSEQNVAAIGTVIHTACKNIGIDNLQIFMFDDKNSDTLNIIPNHKENLLSNNKTGFNPFYHASIE